MTDLLNNSHWLIALFVMIGITLDWFQRNHGKANLSDQELMERYVIVEEFRRKR